MKASRFFLLLCFILVSLCAFELADFSLNQPLPFDADEAHHAARGLDVYDSLRERSLPHLYSSITDQSFYPPLHSLTVAAAYSALGGPSLAASRLPSWIAFLLSIIVTGFAIRMTISKQSKSVPQKFVAYGMGIAAVFAFFSPLSLQNASVCMIEPLSMLVTAGILYMFARYQDELQYSTATALLFGFVFALAALTKYTMLIFVVAPGALALWGIPVFTPKLAHKCALIATLTVLATFGLWLTLSHWEGVWYFLIGFPKRGVALSFAALWTQPAMFLQRCALYPALAVTALAMSVFALAQIRQQRVILFSLLCIFTTLAVLGVSKQQGGRFMLHALPCLWLLCGVGAAQISATWRGGTAMLWSLLLIFCIALPNQRERLHADILRALETKPSSMGMLELVIKSADAAAPVLQIGSNDLFNMESVRWALAAQSGRAFREITVDQFPMDYEKLDKLRYSQPWRAPYDKYRRQIGAGLDKVLQDGVYKTLVIFEGERWLRSADHKAQIAELLSAHPHQIWSDGTNTLTVVQF